MATQFAADRFVYVFSPDKALTSGVGITLDVFQDEACTTPAIITTLQGALIHGARLVVGNDSLLPRFLDTGDHTTLYVRTPGATGAGSAIAALAEDMIDVLIGGQVATEVETYLTANPVSVGLSTDAGNLLSFGTDAKIMLSPSAIPDPIVDHGALQGLADDDHPHYLNTTRGDARYPLATAVTTALAGKVGTSDPRLTDARTPKAHTHAVADTTGLQAALDGKVATSDTRLTDARTPTAHSHPTSDVTGLDVALAGKVGTDDARLSDARTPTAHVHTIANVTGLQAALDAKAASSHVHTIANVTGLQTALDGKAASDHTHDGVYLTQVTGDARYVRTVNGIAPDASGNVAVVGGGGVTDHGALTGLADDDHPHYLNTTRGDARYVQPSAMTTALAGKVDTTDTRLTDARTPTAHTHAQSEVVDLTTTLAGKVDTDDTRLTDARTPTAHTHAVADTTGLQTALDGKAAAAHTHAIGDTTGLQTALDGKQASGDYATNTALTSGLAGKAAAVHTHAIADTTGLQAALDGKQPAGSYQAVGDYATNTDLTTGLAGKAAATHTHAIADVTSLQATLDAKAASTHTHTIANVTDLQATLDSKAATSHQHTIANVTNLQTTLDAKVAASGVTLLGYAADIASIPAGAAVGSVWVIAPGAFTYGPTPTVVASQVSSTSAAGTDLVVTPPAGSQADDVLVAFLTSQDSVVAHNWQAPSGWVLQSAVVPDAGSGLNAALRVSAVMTRVLTGAAEATYTFTSPGSTAQRRAALAILIRGADPALPVGGVTAWQGSDGVGTTDLTVPSQNSTRPSNLQVVFASTNVTSTQSTTPATPSPSLTQRASQTEPASGTVDKTHVVGWTRVVAAAGNSGSITLDFPEVSQRAAIALLLQPAVI